MCMAVAIFLSVIPSEDFHFMLFRVKLSSLCHSEWRQCRNEESKTVQQDNHKTHKTLLGCHSAIERNDMWNFTLH